MKSQTEFSLAIFPAHSQRHLWFWVDGSSSWLISFSRCCRSESCSMFNLDDRGEIVAWKMIFPFSSLWKFFSSNLKSLWIWFESTEKIKFWCAEDSSMVELISHMKCWIRWMWKIAIAIFVSLYQINLNFLYHFNVKNWKSLWYADIIFEKISLLFHFAIFSVNFQLFVLVFC